MIPHMIRSFFLIFICCSVFFSYGQDGQSLYRQNCAVCHKLGARLVGPDLTGVHNKRDREWLVKFIRSSQTMIKAGDTAAVNIFKSYGSVIMPDQSHLSDKDITAIIDFIASGKTDKPAPDGGSSVEKVVEDKLPAQVTQEPNLRKAQTPSESRREIENTAAKGAIVAMFIVTILFAFIAYIVIVRSS